MLKYSSIRYSYDMDSKMYALSSKSNDSSQSSLYISSSGDGIFHAFHHKIFGGVKS